jgi:hypothetical protein
VSPVRLRPKMPLRGVKRATALLALLLLALTSPPESFATPPRPAGLVVRGGAEAWHMSNSFSLDWAVPPAVDPPLAATLFRVRDPQGATLNSGRLMGVSDGLGGLLVPRVPGIYTAELQFEDSSGDVGPAATVELRFDDVRPNSTALGHVPAWIGRSSFPLRIRLGHPAGPQPISGIRGYATAIDRDAVATPCAASDRCTLGETTLPEGIGDDVLSIAALPEGDLHLHAVAVSGSGAKSASAVHAELHVDLTDPVTSLSGVPAGWTNRPVGLVARAVDLRSGMAPSGDGPAPFTAIGVDDGAPTIAPGSTIGIALLGEGVHRIAYYARDAAGNVDDGTLGNRPPHTAVVRIDRTPPALGFANAQDPREPELLRVSVEDVLSGPDPVGGWIGVRPVGSRQRFAVLPALPGPRNELRARWDSDAYGPGRYEFQAVGYDTAGNRAATSRRRNGAAMVLANPLKAPARLEASLGGRPRRTIAYGRGLSVAGRLVTGIRTPIAGATVRIVERFPAGAGSGVRVSTATTGRGGVWSQRLAPGPSREVVASFAGGPSLSRASSAPLDIAVRSGVSLHASSWRARVGGAPIVFDGAVAGAIPVGGLPVQLQFRLPGVPWSEFRTVQADRHGRFRYAYRFSDDDSRGVRFRFRAYVAKNEDWPYEPNGSRPILVEGY